MTYAKETCPPLPDDAQFGPMKRWLFLSPALLFMGGIFWMSSYPAPESLHLFPMWAGIKLVHLIEYGLLTLLWVWGLRNATQWSWRKVAFISILITFCWGISDEYHQSFVPGRTAKAADALTDLLASALVVGLVSFIRGRKAKLCYKSGSKKDEEAL